MKKRILSEKSGVIVLFVTVIITFSLAQQDTKKIERIYQERDAAVTSHAELPAQDIEETNSENSHIIPASY